MADGDIGRIVAGSLKTGMGIASAIYQDQQRDAAAARQRGQANKAWRAKKKQLYAQFHRDLEDYNANVRYTEQLWNAKFEQGMADIQFTNQHAADTYYLRQQQLNQQFQQLAFEDQDRALRHAKSQGVAAAKAQMGVTAGRFDVANAAIKGRNEAIQAREVTGMIDSFDRQSAIDNRVAAHKLDNIGRTMAILPQLGRIPDIPTMPEKPEGFAQNNSGLWMGIAGAVVDGAVTALGGGGYNVPNFMGMQDQTSLPTPTFGGTSPTFKFNSQMPGSYEQSSYYDKPLQNMDNTSQLMSGFTFNSTPGFKPIGETQFSVAPE